MMIFQKMPGHLIRRLHQISVSVFTDHVHGAGFDLTPVQFAALCAVREHPGIDQATLAGAIAYDRVTIGGVVDRLVTKGLMSRVINSRDRRARVLKATPTGEETCERMIPVVSEVQEQILAGLDEAERIAFLSLLAKVTKAGNELSRAPLTLAE